MTLETLYYVSQIVAVLAILGSLIFVGIQIRQNTKQAEESERVARGQVLQHIAAEHRQHSLTTLDYPEVHRCFVEGTDPAEMTDDERSRVATYCFATLHMLQNIFFQHRKGLLDTQVYESYLPFLTSFLSTPAGLEYWDKRRSMFDAEFVQIMDGRFASAAPLGAAVGAVAPEDSDEEPDT